jgi:hypothetical protein
MFMPRQLSHSVEQIARQAVGKDWGLYAALLDHWQEIVGADYASVTTPVKITFPHQPNEARRRDGTLTVRLPKGLAMEFTYKTGQLRQRINGYFGYDAIGRINFDPVFGAPPKTEPSPVPDPQAVSGIEDDVKTIDNNELRSALQSFGEAVLISRPDKA